MYYLTIVLGRRDDATRHAEALRATPVVIVISANSNRLRRPPGIERHNKRRFPDNDPRIRRYVTNTRKGNLPTNI